MARPSNGEPEDRNVPADASAMREVETGRLLQQISVLQEQLQALHHGAPPEPSRMEELERELGRRRLSDQRELELARDFLKRLQPTSLPRTDGISLVVAPRPADQLGGDLYDVFEAGPGSLGIFVADPTGYGLRAALLAAEAKNAFDHLRVNEYSPRTILDRLNTRLCHRTPETQFLTAFIAIIDTTTLRMRYVNASYTEPLVYGQDRCETLCGGGGFVGLFERPEYQEYEVELRPGDHLLIYSDGLCHALDGNGYLYTVERVLRFVREHHDDCPGDLLQALLEDLDAHLRGQPYTDDVTIISAMFAPAAPGGERIEIASEPSNLPRVVEPLMKRLSAAGYGERAEFGVRLALEEALINAMKHGNKMDRRRMIRVRYLLDDRQVEISVADEGNGFDPSAVPDPTDDENLEVAHGRGIVLMRAYVDELRFNEKGNEVTLIKRAPWA